MTILIGSPVRVLGQSSAGSVGSMADFKQQQDAGIAESIRQSQDRARAGKLVMGTTAGNKLAKGGRQTAAPSTPERPAIIHLAVHPSQTGHDYRRLNNVR